MTKLEECRLKIDDIDTQIIKLYEARMNVVKEVIEYKIKNNIPVLDSDREFSMLNNNLDKISSVELKKYYKRVLKGFLDASKEMQEDILDNKSNYF